MYSFLKFLFKNLVEIPKTLIIDYTHKYCKAQKRTVLLHAFVFLFRCPRVTVISYGRTKVMQRLQIVSQGVRVHLPMNAQHSLDSLKKEVYNNCLLPCCLCFVFQQCSRQVGLHHGFERLDAFLLVCTYVKSSRLI